MTEEAKCDCQRCGSPIIFPIDLHNSEVECPHCHKATTLRVPPATVRIRKAEHPPILNDRTKTVAESTIGCSYILCFLIPIAGFFAGIYLMAKKETGHGAACMALSIVIAIVIFTCICIIIS